MRHVLLQKPFHAFFIFLLLGLALLLPMLPNRAGAAGKSCSGLLSEDPMVRIMSLPLSEDVDAILAGISREVSRETGLPQEFITYYWQSIDNINCMGNKTVDYPIFVDLYVPGFLATPEIKGLMTSIADNIEKFAKIDKKWVFIHTHFPRQEQVYISGEVASWDNYQGNADPPSEIRESSPEEENRGSRKGPGPGSFLFEDASFMFQCLWRFGTIAAGGADLGEALTVTSRIVEGDPESWYASWYEMGRHLEDTAREFLAQGHEASAREAYFRACNYYRASEIYLSQPEDPRALEAWQRGRNCFLRAAELSEGEITFVEIPFEETTLPAYWIQPGGTKTPRPTVIVHTGLDGTAEDFYFIIGKKIAQRGYNCLVFEGPGQGEMIRVKKIPFRYNWETVITPVVDYLTKLPEVHPDKIGLLGYSMGGYLAPRAAAFEHRLAWIAVDSGVFSVFDGLMTKFPPEVRENLGDDTAEAEINALVREEMELHPELRQFMNQMLWTFQKESPFQLFRALQLYTVKEVLQEITCPVLVANSIHDQVAGSYEQGKIFFHALEAPKTYLEFSDAEGAQFHCQNGAPSISSERILNWIDEQMKQ
ncbi:MAG TPA: alpha/beta fold hydrolase [Synergistaceae bacterium]|nr:alpha/beta fold hydrolase [Synergistaceae bacterium]